MLFAASVFTAAFKKQCQEMKEQEYDKVEKNGVSGEETKGENKSKGKKKDAGAKTEEAALKKEKEMVEKKIKAAEQEVGVVGGKELSERPKEKEHVGPSTSFPNLIAVDENFLTMCREIGWSTNVSRDALTALQMSLNDFVGRE